MTHSRHAALWPGFWSAALLCRLALIVFLIGLGCGKRESTVTVYASQDQVYAEPILQTFSKQTGIRIQMVYDSEAVKTVGLVNRLLTEQSNPQCDVFWNNEEFRTRQLEARGVIERWASVGYRSRQIVINTNLISSDLAPKALADLTNAVWKGKIALAYPLFGTTATHFLALRQLWGADHWERWCRALQANKPFLVDGNSVVVQFVGRGEAVIGLTDSDDVASGQQQGMPLQALPISSDALLIPNTIALIRRAPHPSQAVRLYEYLQSPEVRQKLVDASALESASMADANALKIHWERLLQELEPATAALREIFLR